MRIGHDAPECAVTMTEIRTALKAGQRVVSNIEGLNPPEIAKYLKISEERVNELLTIVKDEQVLAPGFYPKDAHDQSAIVKPGALLLLDEVWRFYKKEMKLSAECMSFFRMHRHYAADDTGLTSEIVLCIQSVRGLHPDIRDIIEVRFQCRKLKIIGRPDMYQVWLFEGQERKPSHKFDRKYNPAIFPLYQSHAKGGAIEQVDPRQNMLGKALHRLGKPLALIAIPLGIAACWYGLNKLTHPKGSETPSAIVTPPGATPGTASATVQPANSNDDSWRVIASYTVNGQPVVKLLDGNGRFRTLSPGQVSVGASGEIYVTVARDEKRVTPWSGSFPTYGTASSNKPK